MDQRIDRMRIDRMRIGVLGLTPGAGAGFLCSCLARAAFLERNLRPAVLELGCAGLYDSLAMDKRLPAGRYFSFHHTVASDRSIRGRSNLVDGVNWMLVDGQEAELDLYQRLRLVHNAEGELVFCRLSGVPEAELWKLMPEMDRILAVIDPLPSSMLAGYERLCELRTDGSPITYIVNKYNDGVDRRELLQFLNVSKPIFVPMVAPEAVYGAEYACRTVYDMAPAKKVLQAPCREILSVLL